MGTRTDQKRYLTELTTALRMRNISGARIGEIVAEVEEYTAESGRDARESFGAPREYARQFESAVAEPNGRLWARHWGRGAWTGVLTAAIGGWLLAAGAFAGMRGDELIGLSGWWASGIGAAILLITFSLMPIDLIVDPRRSAAERQGRKRWLSWAVGAVVVVFILMVILLIGGVMTLFT